ncbi:MAG: hypothetical protein ACRC30_10970 [Clostridium sp.]
MHGKKWGEEELEYLKENWGVKTINVISKNLNRTEAAIVSKSIKVGLSRYAYYSADITFNQLLIGIGQAENYKYYKKKLIKLGCPLKFEKVSSTRKNKVCMINIDKFWKWLEKNQHEIDFSKFEQGMLGLEPEWVDRKRNNDINRKRRVLNRPWTQGDDRRLIDLVNEYRYGYREISERLMRSHSAVMRRLQDLGIKGRPLRESSRNVWTTEQLKELRELVLKRVRYCQITDFINKSEKAIRGKVYVLFGSENIDKAANNILERKL